VNAIVNITFRHCSHVYTTTSHCTSHVGWCFDSVFLHFEFRSQSSNQWFETAVLAKCREQ